jgi:quercetin dioxygenase-like cupin family protein
MAGLSATVIRPGDGEIIGDSADRRVEILCDHDALHATWSRFGPGREGADLHVHRRHTDLFYVLDGELTLRLGPAGEEVAAPAGTLARVPPLVVHGFRNGSDADVRYLNLHAPGEGFAGYMRSIRDGDPRTYDQHEPPADGGTDASEAVFRGGDGVLADIAEIAVAVTRIAGGGQVAPAPEEPGRLVAVFVLEGELLVTTSERAERAPAGAWVQVAPGVAVAAPEPARVLEIRAPGGRKL